MYTLIPEDIGRYLSYDQTTGKIVWRAPRQAVRVGMPAGTVGKDGRLYIHFLGKRLFAHRVAWFLAYGVQPSRDIDHVDRDPLNNRLRNLRLATTQQNAANRSATGKLRTKGVTPLRGGRFMAQIKHNGVNHYLGCYSSAEEAAAAYNAKASEFFGEFGGSA